MLTSEGIARAEAAIGAPTEIFSELVRIAGLDPARAFVGARLHRVDLRGSDLTGFDLSGADLTDAVIEGVTGLEGLVTDDETVMSEEFREMIRVAREEADEQKASLPSP